MDIILLMVVEGSGQRQHIWRTSRDLRWYDGGSGCYDQLVEGGRASVAGDVDIRIVCIANSEGGGTAGDDIGCG